MGVMTVFLTVSFITFLDDIGQLSPIIVLSSSIFTSGDFDILITGNIDKIEHVNGNQNYYNDPNEFFTAPYLTKSEKTNKLTEQSLLSKIPLVNFTAVNDVINKAYAKSDKKPVELFPRWMA